MPVPPVGPGPDLPALEPAGGETAPAQPFLPARPPRPRLDNLSARERGVAVPRGVGGVSHNMRVIVIALSVLVLAGCCTLSWSAASAIFPQPGGPVAAASGSPTASENASATDQPTATFGGTPTAVGGDMTATPSVSPTDTPPTPTANPCPDPYNNPWGYNFCMPGSVIAYPPVQFCARQYFPCVKGFWNQSGYVVECLDGRYARSGGTAFVCSSNGGYWRTLLQHPIA